MVDYREILRLNSLGNSQRQIEETVHSGHHTISDTLAAAREKGIAWPLDESMTNEKLQAILFPGKFQQRPQYLEPDYAYIHRELAKPGVTLALLWEEYCAKAKSVGAQPYMTTQFREKYHIWARVQNATMRLKHKPGDVMEVDWAGNTIPIYDPDTGAEDEAYLFVAVLPFSAYAYVEACADMKSECWIRCHMHAYEYFGGVTRLLVPDNLKTGVITNTRYDTVLDKSYREMAEHYGTAIVPTRVRHPKDKPYAEGAVKRTYQKILAPLRNRKFFSVHEANEAVAVQLEVLNTTPFQKRKGCRKSAFEQDEKEFLRPLPTMQYEPATWLKAKVPTDYLISDGKNKYSVPFDLIGEEVDIRLTKSNVEVFFKGSRVASHVRVLRAMRDPIIFEEHMTPEHRKYLRYNADDFRVWAKSVGRKTENVIEYLLTSNTVDGKEVILAGLTSGYVTDYRRFKEKAHSSDCYPRQESISGIGGAVHARDHKPETEWLSAFAAQPGFRVVMSHHPEYLPLIPSSVDLILSGHAHGGQWRVFNHGVWAPGQGWWPRWTRGVYENRLVISAGLSNTTWIPRIWNPTEIVYLEP